MKSSKILDWTVLLSVSLLAACGGVSSIGSGNSGGSSGTSGAGHKTAGAPGTSTEAKGGRGGTTSMEGRAGGPSPGIAGSGAMPGAGASTGIQPCTSDMECPGAGEPCQVCADGTTACNMGYCDATSGICKRNGGVCTPKCSSDMDCPVPDLACTDCGDGSQACPISQCRVGFCEVSYPGCGGHDPCEGKECGYLCDSCPPDGMCDASVLSFCNGAGKCRPGPPSCGQNKCQTSMDCGSPPPICVPCVDGTCAGFDCVDNRCAYNCPTSSLQCKYTADCVFDGQCKMCPSGECAVPACIESGCKLVCPL